MNGPPRSLRSLPPEGAHSALRAAGRALIMLLMLDNYDSFTYNLVQYLSELGADVRVYRNDAITVDEVAELGPAQIVVSPGPCTPDEAGISVPLIQRFAGRIPILGVCLGIRRSGRRSAAASCARNG